MLALLRKEKTPRSQGDPAGTFSTKTRFLLLMPGVGLCMYVGVSVSESVHTCIAPCMHMCIHVPER